MEADDFEQRIEYERLCDSLTGRGSDELVLRLHAAHSQLGGGSKLIHLHAVSELAAQHANNFYVEHDFNAQRYWTTSCRLAGLLHESMDWGGNYEDLIYVADETVARLVSALTGDRRIPKPKRMDLLANQIGLGGAPAQIIKLADLQHDCFHLLGLPLGRPDEMLLELMGEWLDDARLILRSMVKIQESPLLDAQVADLRVKMSQLSERLGEAWKKQARKKRR